MLLLLLLLCGDVDKCRSVLDKRPDQDMFVSKYETAVVSDNAGGVVDYGAMVIATAASWSAGRGRGARSLLLLLLYFVVAIVFSLI